MRALALLLATAGAPAAAADLTVDVHGAIPGTGQLLVALFDSEPAWLATPAAELTVPVDGAGKSSLTFPGLAPGRYGVSIVYDQNANGELDLNLLGIPSEGFGFSNDARAMFGPPGWDETGFDIGAEDLTISIRLDRAD